jgi:hypothetical protein
LTSTSVDENRPKVEMAGKEEVALDRKAKMVVVEVTNMDLPAFR